MKQKQTTQHKQQQHQIIETKNNKQHSMTNPSSVLTRQKQKHKTKTNKHTNNKQTNKQKQTINNKQ